MTNTREKTLKMVQVAFLAALIVAMQALATVTTTFLPFSITLTLVPIVIGGILLGPAYGAALGILFGVIVVVMCAAGMDAGGAIVFQANPFLCTFLCLLKGCAAGFVPALLFSCTREYRKDNEKRSIIITMLGAALCPTLNTGIFCLGMVIFFKDVLMSWAGGTDLITYMILGLAGINFVIEFAINIILCPILVRYLRKTKFFKSVV